MPMWQGFWDNILTQFENSFSEQFQNIFALAFLAYQKRQRKLLTVVYYCYLKSRWLVAKYVQLSDWMTTKQKNCDSESFRCGTLGIPIKTKKATNWGYTVIRYLI